jgi:CBS-domain-containing membrane protein
MITRRPNRRISIASLVILLSLALVPAAGAEGTIYKWTDKEGNVHYTDCPPPPGCKAETVAAEPVPSEQQIRQARERLDKLLSEQEQSAAGRELDRLERQGQQVAAMQVAVARKRACVSAQQNLHALLMNRPVYYINEKGERVFLDDAAHKAEIERQRQLVQDNCDNE